MGGKRLQGLLGLQRKKLQKKQKKKLQKKELLKLKQLEQEQPKRKNVKTHLLMIHPHPEMMIRVKINLTKKAALRRVNKRKLNRRIKSQKKKEPAHLKKIKARIGAQRKKS